MFWIELKYVLNFELINKKYLVLKFTVGNIWIKVGVGTFFIII
jgi:hypothetical protein